MRECEGHGKRGGTKGGGGRCVQFVVCEHGSYLTSFQLHYNFMG